ncbi:YkvA family protein [Ferrimonas lipolytica]|uniref:DUF1232 domain-containing protein n=1 Tax=Ferrimonas lipolytica TaxID=2724191 RepID=A0A6H1UF13_9GAMM|nr:YkvA family protein [Ferrimonas lipolytica]QIZ77671.1 DUF1232 domain-containing protein [Ferrimonas lipolytica]
MSDNFEAPSADSFWDKIKTNVRAMGRQVAVQGISCYLAMTDSKTSTASKAILGGALAYLVMPLDAIPDFMLGLGYTDDAAVMLAALKASDDVIKPEHDEEAERIYNEL